MTDPRPARAQRAPGSAGARNLAGKVAQSLVTVAAGVGLMAFGTFGAFGDGDDEFPHSVVVGPSTPG